MNILKFSDYSINENLGDELKDKLSNKYLSLKRGIILLIEKNLGNSKTTESLIGMLEKVRNTGINNTKIIGFIENADIINFYLKYQADIDDLLHDEKYFDIKPSDNAVFSLNEFIIDGTKKSVEFAVEIIVEEIK